MSDDQRSVAFAVESLRIGGAERVVCNLAQAFDDRGWNVDVVVFRELGPLAAELPPSIEVVNLRSRRMLIAIPSLARWLRRERPDAVVANLTHVNLATLLAERIARVAPATVIVEHSQFSERIERLEGRKEALTARLAGRLYPTAAGVVAVSDGLADDVAAVTGMDRSLITTIYNPVDVDSVRERSREPVDLPDAVDDGSPVLVSVGRLGERKDVPTTLRAFRTVLEDRDCWLVLCGDGPERRRLESLATELGIRERVHFTGWVDNPYPYMRRADVLVLSSKSEGLGNVLIEAMAVGCPVVSTDCESGPGEILEGGTWGPLVPVGDHEELTSAILETLDDPIDSEDLMDRAHDFRVEAAYDGYTELLGPS